MPKFYDMPFQAPEENPETIYFYIAESWKASRALLSFLVYRKEFERVKAEATPEELQMLKICIEYIRAFDDILKDENLKANMNDLSKHIPALDSFLETLPNSIKGE